jgi:hypothetical protein
MNMGMGMRKPSVASRKNVTKAVWYILVQLSSLIEKILNTKILKSQITKHKYQMVRQARHPELSRRANHNDRNSKYQTVWVIEKLRFGN